MTLIHCVNARREPADRGMTNRGMCTMYPNVKLLNIVTWNDWYVLVPRPSDEDEEKQENKQDGDDGEERWSKQDNNDNEEIWSKQDNGKDVK